MENGFLIDFSLNDLSENEISDFYCYSSFLSGILSFLIVPVA